MLRWLSEETCFRLLYCLLSAPCIRHAQYGQSDLYTHTSCICTELQCLEEWRPSHEPAWDHRYNLELHHNSSHMLLGYVAAQRAGQER